MFSFHFVRGVWHQLECCISGSSFSRKKTNSLPSLIGKNQDIAKCFQNHLSQSGELRHKEQAANNTRPLKWGKKNHSNHADSEESPRISSLLVNGDARVAPRLHSPFHQAKPVGFLSCVQAVVSYTIWWEKLEAADGKQHLQGTQPPPSRFQGWEWERAMAEQTKWLMSHQHGPEGDIHEKFESPQI